MDDLVHPSFPSQGSLQGSHEGSQSQAPASAATTAVNEAETFRMSTGDFQQAAVLESNKRAFQKRMGLK